MGRIGRMIVRSIIESKNNNIEIKHINNRTNTEVCSNLLKYDTVHGKFNADIKFEKNYLSINKKIISFSQETDLKKIKWKNSGVDIVFECTGRFNSKEESEEEAFDKAERVVTEYEGEDPKTFK